MKKIFAYGSLMNTNDLRRTVPEARNFFPAKLYGYKRVFNLKSTHRFDVLNNTPICVLNLEPASSVDFVNGICFDMDDKSFDQLLDREKAYTLLEAKVYSYFPESQHHRSHFFVSKNNNNYPYQLNSDIQLDYLKVCIRGCLEYGSKFFQDFKTTTDFWGIDPSQYEQLIWHKIRSIFAQYLT